MILQACQRVAIKLVDPDREVELEPGQQIELPAYLGMRALIYETDALHFVGPCRLATHCLICWEDLKGRHGPAVVKELIEESSQSLAVVEYQGLEHLIDEAAIVKIDAHDAIQQTIEEAAGAIMIKDWPRFETLQARLAHIIMNEPVDDSGMGI